MELMRVNMYHQVESLADHFKKLICNNETA